MHDLENILSKFQKIVSPEFCYSLAREVNFIQRSTSLIQGYEFAQALIVPNAFLAEESLNSLAARMKRINKNCDLSASALFQRMNTEAAELYMKKLLSEVFSEIVKKHSIDPKDFPNLKFFNRILIEDSTMVELHEKLSSTYKGRGGAASKSALKINYVFDYVSGQIVEIEVCSGNKPDQSLAGQIIPHLKQNDIVIRDLGYYVLKKFKEVEKAGGYNISRLKSNVDVFENANSAEPLDLARHIEKHMKDGLVDIKVFIGAEKHPVRLIACKMTEEAINKRLRDANRNAQRCGRKISIKKKELLKYSIFITTISAEILSATSIMALYRGRWSAELIFKQWKSCLKIHVFKGSELNRIHCLLYGRLAMVLLLGSISPILMRDTLELGRELSSYKMFNYFIADHVFARAVQENNMSHFINELFNDLLRRLCKDKRNRLTLRENVQLGNSFHNFQNHKGLSKNVA